MRDCRAHVIGRWLGQIWRSVICELFLTVTFIPFVMEATGDMSTSAQDLYERIALASRIVVYGHMRL